MVYNGLPDVWYMLVTHGRELNAYRKKGDFALSFECVRKRQYLSHPLVALKKIT